MPGVGLVKNRGAKSYAEPQLRKQGSRAGPGGTQVALACPFRLQDQRTKLDEQVARPGRHLVHLVP